MSAPVTDSLMHRSLIAVGATPDRGWLRTAFSAAVLIGVGAALLFLLQFAG